MMSRKRATGGPMPAVDESWWQAVLAEEGSNDGPRSGHQPRPRIHGDHRADGAAHTSPNWEHVQELFRNDEIVELRVAGCNKGGLLVEAEDLSGFVPFSHLIEIADLAATVDRARLLEQYVGRTLRLKIIECIPVDGRIVFSERAAQAEPGRRAELFRSLRAGEQIGGTITNITDFGVFVDLGGVEGLIHISELSWGRVAHPNQHVQVGEHVKVEVLDLSPERCRVALSLKRLLPNPWKEIERSLRTSPSVRAVITSVLSYGAFARLEQGVEGLIHVSEMPLAEGQSVREFLHEGQPVDVRVLHVDAANQRMGLSMNPEA
jgi:small subunit ribosomal protein S1